MSQVVSAVSTVSIGKLRFRKTRCRRHTVVRIGLVSVHESQNTHRIAFIAEYSLSFLRVCCRSFLLHFIMSGVRSIDLKKADQAATPDAP